MVRRPAVFLFDEPLANLDPQMRARLRTEVSAIREESVAAIVYVTHDQTEAMALGDRIAVMKDGRIEQMADPMTLYHQPASIFVARFIGTPAMNCLRGSLIQNGGGLWIECAGQEASSGDPALRIELGAGAAERLKNCKQKQIVLGIRPEGISLQAGLSGKSAVGLLETIVERLEVFGYESHLYLRPVGHSLAALVHPNPAISPGHKRHAALHI